MHPIGTRKGQSGASDSLAFNSGFATFGASVRHAACASGTSAGVVVDSASSSASLHSLNFAYPCSTPPRLTEKAGV